MRTVVIGKSGQLAFELSRLLGDAGVFLGRNSIDITCAESVRDVLNELKPTAIINASAYTAVDKAETEQEQASLVNTQGVKNLAEYCRLNNAFLVHVSTDYVFNGEKGSPYLVNDPIEPQGVYGASKAAGEKALLEILPEHSCLIRTAWVYSSHGNNFVKTMLKLMATKPQLTVIDDQIGSPTWAKGLAEACLHAANQSVAGVYHWTDEGVASWYDFAIAIQNLALEKGLLKKAIPITPIPSSDYPTPAKRPHYSVLDKTLTRTTFSALQFNHWQQQLSLMMDELG